MSEIVFRLKNEDIKKYKTTHQNLCVLLTETNAVTMTKGLNTYTGFYTNRNGGYILYNYDSIYIFVKYKQRIPFRYMAYIDIPENDTTTVYIDYETGIVKSNEIIIKDQIINIWTSDIYVDLIKKNGVLLEYVDEYYKTYELCKSACENNALAIYYTPHKFKTQELYNIIVNVDPYSIRTIPKEYINYTMVENIFKQTGCGILINYIPPNLIDNRLCELSIESYSDAIFILIDMINNPLNKLSDKIKITEKLCCMSVNTTNNQQTFTIFMKNYETYITPEFCMTAIKNNGLLIKYISKYMTIDNNLCELAIKQNGNAIQYIPTSMITQSLCYYAIESTVEAYNYIPTKYINNLLCQTILQKDISMLDRLHKDMFTKKFTEELWMFVVKTAKVANLKYCPDEYKTLDVCITAYQWCKDNKRYIPETTMSLVEEKQEQKRKM